MIIYSRLWRSLWLGDDNFPIYSVNTRNDAETRQIVFMVGLVCIHNMHVTTSL